jgi:hypothetical protein
MPHHPTAGTLALTLYLRRARTSGVAWRGVAWRGVAWRGVRVAWRVVVWGWVWCGVGLGLQVCVKLANLSGALQARHRQLVDPRVRQVHVPLRHH